MLYNGEEIWDVLREFRKIIYNEELFGTGLLNRIKAIALFFHNLADTERKALKNWIKNTVAEPLAESAIKILEPKM